MKLLFEGYNYSPDSAAHRLLGKGERWINSKGVACAVGYYYAGDFGIDDTVIIMPKIFLQADVKDRKRLLAFGRLDPETIIDFPDGLDNNEKHVVFEVSTMLFRAISRYRDEVGSIATEEKGIFLTGENLRKEEKTYLETILSLYDFYRDHRNFITFITRLNNSGDSNIQWEKTIGRKQPYIQDDEPVYMDFVTREKALNLDEEIIVLLISTLNWLKHEGYCFNISSPFNYNLIPASRISVLVRGGGVKYLNRIRHKYYNDTLVELWKLLFMFYSKSELVARGKYTEKPLVIRKFNNVFERMIDDIITDRDLFDESTEFRDFRQMKDQPDGKLVDHLYHSKSLFSDSEMIFVGDSKYYRDDHDITGTSLYKQFTYAKNVIQHNLDNYVTRGKWLSVGGSQLRYRDTATEGYDFTPNFFIRGSIDFKNDMVLSKMSPIHNNCSELFSSCQFFNRLFDRDTLFLLTVDVNFLFILQHYARKRHSSSLKDEFRRTIRKALIDGLSKRYDFYLVTIDLPLMSSVSNLSSFIFAEFTECRGRMFRKNENTNEFIVALDKTDVLQNKIILNSISSRSGYCSCEPAILDIELGIIKP